MQTPDKNGLILHTGAIGDCLLTLPLAAALKARCALDRLDFIGPSESIAFYPQRTAVDRVRSMHAVALHRLFDRRLTESLTDNDPLIAALAGYEYIVSFLGAGDAQVEYHLLYLAHCSGAAEVTVIDPTPPADSPHHVTDRFHAALFGADDTNRPGEAVTVAALPEDYTAGAALLEQAGVDPEATVVLIQPGSGAREKCWHWQNFIQVAAALADGGVRPVFLLGPAERERFSPEALAAVRTFPVLEGRTLTEVLAVLTQADAFLGNDSGIGHLAAAMGKNTHVLFGPSSPTHYAPRGPRVTVCRPGLNGFIAPDPPGAAAVAAGLLDIR